MADAVSWLSHVLRRRYERRSRRELLHLERGRAVRQRLHAAYNLDEPPVSHLADQIIEVRSLNSSSRSSTRGFESVFKEYGEEV